MTHKHFTKSTKEEVLEMLKMVKEGLSFSEIGRRLHKDHTSVMYWISKIGPNNVFVENFSPDRVIMNLEVDKKEVKVIDPCKICKKEKKDKRWKMTDYCSLKCYAAEHQKNKSNLYW